MQLADCHPNRKHKARGLCGACYQKWLVENSPVYREKYQTYQAAYHADEANKQRAIERAKYHAKKNKDVPKFQRERRNRTLLRKYGITIEQYERMLADQGGGCAICTRKPGTLPLHVDHSHTTGAVRGLLCHQCNWYLGTIEGGPGVFTRLLGYLNQHAIV